MSEPNAAFRYLADARKIFDCIEATQMDAIEQASQWCAETIARHGLVHLFGTGHSRIPIEEIFPRHGSYPGWHPMVELSMTFHTQVVGSNGQRQAMFIEKMPGLGEEILKNFVFRPYDTFMIFSNSGVNNVVVEVAQGAKARGMRVIAVVSGAHTGATPAKHKSGQKLTDVADLTLDNCTPAGDALVTVEGLAYPVGPGSTVGYALLVNALKSRVAELLTERGQPPLVLTSSVLIGAEKSAALFEATYDDYRERVKVAFGG